MNVFAWDVLVAIILGIVEGLTEFAPVSSTGHMILIGEGFLHFTGERAITFEIFVQLGSILAVIVIFWQRLLNLVGLHPNPSPSSTTQGHLTPLHILIAMMPAVIVGLLVYDYIKLLFSIHTVLIGLVAGGILMILAEKIRKPASSHNLDEITYRQAFVVGLFQCFALWPGFSRSGSTISGGLLTGINHTTASEFSFIVAVPMMVAANGLSLYKSWDQLSASDIPLFAIGFMTAFIISLLAITFFLKLIAQLKLTPFAIYRFAIAALFYLIFL
jgi:undecaprenyl-diphosphatase